MKQKRKLAAGILSFAVLAGAWVLAFWRSEEDIPPAEEAAAAQSFIDLSPGKLEDITTLSWTYEGETCILSRDSETGLWKNLEDKNCPLDSSLVDELARAAAQAQAVMEIQKPGDMEQYGLDEPFITLLAATDERVISYELGNMTLDGECYVRVDGQDTVYTETGTLIQAFRVHLTDLLAAETLAETASAVTALTVRTEGESYTVSFCTAAPDGWYGSGSCWFAEREDGLFPLESRPAEEFCAAVARVSLSACVAWEPEDMAQLGLDPARGSAEITYLDDDGRETVLLLEFGDWTESGVYIRSGNSGLAYTADSAVLDLLMHPDWDSLALRSLCPLNWDPVTGARLTLDGRTLEIERITGISGDDPSGEPEDYLLVGGWTLEPERIDAWLARLHGIQGEPTVSAPSGEALMTLVFHMGEQTELSLSVYPYDSSRYLCLMDSRSLLCDHTALDSLINDAREIIATI